MTQTLMRDGNSLNGDAPPRRSSVLRQAVRADLPQRLRLGVEAQTSRLALRLGWGVRAAFSGVRAEFRVPGHVQQSCFLCTTWRSGSTFLGDALRAAVDLDLSHEPFYLNRQQATLGAVLSGRSLLMYLQHMVARRTNPHGVLGIKVMWTDFGVVLRRLQAIPELSELPGTTSPRKRWQRSNRNGSASELEVLQLVFPEPVFLFLTRSDKLHQAISLYRAEGSHVWHRDIGGRLYTTPGPARADPDYDYRRIRAARKRIERDEERWKVFFHRNGIQPLEITYEDICQDLRAVVGRITERLGHDVSSERLDSARPKYVKMADATTEEWVDRFRREEASRTSSRARDSRSKVTKAFGLDRHFLVIGAQRAGTTWLYKHLRAHPDIWLPPVKEVHFFDRSRLYPTPSFNALPPGLARLSLILSPEQPIVRRYVDVWDWFRTADRQPWSALWFSLSYPFSTIDDDWYRRLFSFGGERITGDITPGYSLLSDEDVARVHELVPEARIVLILRNPIERAWSNFKLDCKTSGIRLDDTWAAEFFFGRRDVFMRGDYATMLLRWRKQFGEDRVCVGYYEDLVEDPSGHLRGILGFVGARPDVAVSGLKRRVNKSTPDAMPDKIRQTLSRQYRESLCQLCAIQSGHAEAWLREAERDCG